MSLYEKVLFLIKKKGITIYSLEKATGLSIGTITKWQSSRPSADALVKIANYFDVSVDYLLGRDEQQKNSPVETEEFDEILMLARDLQNLDPDDFDLMKKLINSMRDKQK